MRKFIAIVLLLLFCTGLAENINLEELSDWELLELYAELQTRNRVEEWIESGDWENINLEDLNDTELWTLYVHMIENNLEVLP